MVLNTNNAKGQLFKYFILCFCVIASTGFAQHYLTGGVGLIVSLYNSDGLDHFVTTYNDVNYYVLTNPASNFSNAFGVRGEIGYRYMGDLSAAALIGYQNYSFENGAGFSNGEDRIFKLSFDNIFIEGELGYNFGNFLLNGILGFYVNRDVVLEATYNGLAYQALTGKYPGETSFSSDIGICFGVFKKPFFLLGRITYPIYTGGNDDRLIDNNPDKIEDDLYKFPDNYWAYTQRESYNGVASDIDGIKFLITLSYAIQIAD